jgi:hypothetical protein
MSLELHPDAVTEFDRRGNELVLELVRQEELPQAPFQPDLLAAVSFMPKDLNDMQRTLQDAAGNPLARYFQDSRGQFVGLAGDSYKKFGQLVENMQKIPAIRDKLSKQFIEASMFSWLRERHNNETDQTMTRYVLLAGEEQVTEKDVWVPIAGAYAQREFTVGRIAIRTISRQMFESWFDQLREFQSQDALRFLQLLQEKQRRLQGLMAATIHVTAELTRAHEIALAEADKAVGVLRLFVSPPIIPGAVSSFDLLGRQSAETAHYLAIEDGKLPIITVGYAERGITPAVLSMDLIALYNKAGLSTLSELLAAGPSTDFQERMLSMVFQYSRAALATSLSDQLTYIFSALDAFLLRDASEPIQQNIAERIAFIVGSSPDERKLIIKNVKDAYGLRSRFLHHSQTVNDTEILEPFLYTIWQFVLHVIKYSTEFTTRHAFLDAVEERKLS